MRPGGETVLVVAAHPDDEVLGCGATIARHAAEGDRVVVLVLGEGATSREEGDAEALASLRRDAARAAEILGVARLELRSFPDNRFDTVPLLEVVRSVETLLREEAPSVLYTHHPGDVNVDHGVTHRACLAAARPLPGAALRAFYLFEVPSSTEWQTPAAGTPFVPDRFVEVSATLPRKIEAIGAYESECRPWPHPRSPEALRALAAWRGATAGLSAAEAFVVGREIRR